MKHYFKKLPVFLYICVALIANSCAEEKDFVNRQNHEKIKMEDQSFDKLLQLPVFNDAYQRVVKAKVKIPNSTMARTALEEQYGFDIVTQVPVRTITTADKGTYYVLLIERPIEEYLKFENLIINVKDTVVTAAIIKYEMANLAEKLDAIDSYIFDFTDTSITSLVIDGKMMYYGPCADVNTLWCNQSWTVAGGTTTPHPAIAGCLCNTCGSDFLWVVTTQIGDCGNGGGSTGPSGATGPAGASGGAAAGSVYASPLPCLECVEETPCDELKKLIVVTPQNPINPFRQALIQNQNDATGSSFEKGYRVKTGLVTHSTTVEPIVNTTNECNALKFDIFVDMIGFFHSHTHVGNCNLIEMFTEADMLMLYYIAANHNLGNPLYADGTPVNLNSFVMTMGTVYGTYAIKINNLEAFKSILADALTSKESFERFERKFDAKLKKDSYSSLGIYNGDSSINELNMLKIINTMFQNSVSLYKTNDDFTSWNKLVIKNENSFAEPCKD